MADYLSIFKLAMKNAMSGCGVSISTFGVLMKHFAVAEDIRDIEPIRKYIRELPEDETYMRVNTNDLKKLEGNLFSDDLSEFSRFTHNDYLTYIELCRRRVMSKDYFGYRSESTGRQSNAKDSEVPFDNTEGTRIKKGG